MSRTTHLRGPASAWRIGVVCLVAAAAVPVVPVGATVTSPALGGPDDIDVLRATDAQLGERIAELDAQRSATADALAGAHAAADEARRRVSVARAAEQRARRAAERADDEVRRVAVSAYVGESDLDQLAVFSAADPAEANRVSVYLRHEAERRKEVFDTQREAHRRLEAATDSTENASEAFDDAVSEREALLGRLEADRETQVLFAAAVDERIEAKLAEAEALAEIDAAAAEAIAVEADVLGAVNRGETTDSRGERLVVAAGPAPDEGPVPPPPPPAPPTTAAPTPRPPTPAPASPTPAAPPVTAAPPAVPAVAVTKVGPFVVATSIAFNVRALLDASAQAGFVLGGSGFRDPQRQIELRIAHCGSTFYDIWQRPSSQCSPPTAWPGRSMHEQGLALDITCSGSLIRSRSSPCFFWLAVNASTYGLYNLPSEPWHWSTTGT